MSRKLICFCLFLVLGAVSSSYADVIGNWEDTTGDGWGAWISSSLVAASPLPITLSNNFTYSQSTVGATLNNHSLKVAGSGYNQCLAVQLTPSQVADFLANDKFRIDVTYNSGDWDPNTTYAQVYEMSINASGLGWKDVGGSHDPNGKNGVVFTDTLNPGYPGGLPIVNPGTPGTTLTGTWTWDYSGIKSQITATPSSGYIQLIITLNSNKTGAYYFDKARFAPGSAWNPSPANGATDVNLTPTLSWADGNGATSHNVYFGTSSPGTFQGNQAGSTFNPGTLTNSTTYYWRIDEVNGTDVNTTGTVWSFTTIIAAPGKASNPSPANEATDINLTPTLSWTADVNATSHDVYFGTSSPGTFQGNQSGTTFDPGTLAHGTTYYWRIDEKNVGGTTTGDIWSFTTVFVAPGKASNPSPADESNDVNVTPTLSWTADVNATSHDVYFGTSSPGTFQGNQAGTTFNPGTLANTTTYYWRIDEKNPGGTTTGDVWSFTTSARANKATNPSPANGATDINLTPTLSWTAGAGATSHDVYFGTSSPGTFQGNQAGTTFDPGTLAHNTTYYWRIDEKNDGGTTTGDIWSFTTVVAAPGKASNPSPADGAKEIDLAPTLNWTADANATSHDVYFGTSSPGTFRGNQAGTTFNPGTLTNGTTYYWRIDEKNAGGTTTGDIWQFTTPTMTIKKCTVTAGKTQANDANLLQDATDINNIKDGFTASGTGIFPTNRGNINYIDVNIVSGDGNVIYCETIDFNDHNNVVLKHGKYNYSHRITRADPNGAITSLTINFNKNPQTFALTAKNINLTGLTCPVELDFWMGDNLLWGDANEAIVNGKSKTIPTRLMRMYDDTLIVKKAKVKNSTKDGGDSLSVTGEIAVEDINNTNMGEPNLVTGDVNIVWGSQNFVIPAHNLKAAKKGHSYKCNKIVADANIGDAGKVTAAIDLDKCTYAVSVSEVNLVDVNGIVPFGLRFADFNEAVDVNLARGY